GLLRDRCWRLRDCFTEGGVYLLEAVQRGHARANEIADLREHGVEVWVTLRRELMVGVILLGIRKAGRAYYAQQLQFVEAFARIAAAAVEVDLLHRRQLTA